MSNKFDTDIKNYSISELFSIIGVDIESDEDEIIKKTNKYIYDSNYDAETKLFLNSYKSNY